MNTKTDNYSIAQVTPICVDLDGTILRTDILIESIFATLHDFRILIVLPKWLFHGKAKFKAKLAENVEIDPSLLPYNKKVLLYLKEQKKRGRQIFLVTGANIKVAVAINQYLKLFDDIIASSDKSNLSGMEKAKVLEKRFGEQNFSYIANSKVDCHIWKISKTGILVNTSKRVTKRAAELTIIEDSFNDNPSRLKILFHALRTHQWVKNLLIFVPIITANAYGEIESWVQACLIFFAFCFTASGIYIINDFFDLEADRTHLNKRKRPFASGDLPLTAGLLLAPLLLILGLSFGLAFSVLAMILLYIAISVVYSAKLKKMPLIDLFTLALLYTIRLFAGGQATGHHVSFWLLAFSGFLFLALATIKRIAELKLFFDRSEKSGFVRGYEGGDMAVLQTIGIGASFASSIVLALYVESDVAKSAYENPKILWCIVPIMLFWQCRLWLSTTRGYMHDDPIVYAVNDWVSWLIAVFIGAILISANNIFVF